MFRSITMAASFLLVTTQAISAQEGSQSEEAQAWAAAQESGASGDVSEFIQQYPAGAYTTEAKALLIDLLWKELDGDAPVQAAQEEPAAAQAVVAVSFNAPLTEGAPEIVGKSIEELIKGSPLFPPVEGLPTEYWQEQECSNCHEWEVENLCTQANFYLTDAGQENLGKRHPYGGTFKQNLRHWASGGCE